MRDARPETDRRDTVEAGTDSRDTWSRSVKKTLYTLNVGNYAPELCALTYPLMEAYARKIGADFFIIDERRFPEWPPVYEKLQIFELGKRHQNDWNIFVDSDALISPEMFDVTEHLRKDTVCHNGKDMAGIRWKYDKYFRRDGRHIGSCNWFTVASDWCLDLWRPLEDLSLDEAMHNINITIGERNSGLCSTEHLVDDYTLSRNIARFGLKVQTVIDLCGQLGWRGPTGQGTSPFFYHKYTISNRRKAQEMLALLTTPHGQVSPAGTGWGLMTPAGAAEYLRRFEKEVGRPSDSYAAGSQVDPRDPIDRPSDADTTTPAPGSHIQGWMTGEELIWLQESARSLESVVEIGSWKGRSTFALCASGCARVYAVDHFRGSREHQGQFGFVHGWSPLPEFEQNILERFRNVELKQMSSAEAVKDFQDASVDMVFVDGAREYEAVLQDLRLWEPKARDLVAVHCQSYLSVGRAINEYFGRSPDSVVGDIAIFRK